MKSCWPYQPPGATEVNRGKCVSVDGEILTPVVRRELVNRGAGAWLRRSQIFMDRSTPLNLRSAKASRSLLLSGGQLLKRWFYRYFAPNGALPSPSGRGSGRGRECRAVNPSPHSSPRRRGRNLFGNNCPLLNYGRSVYHCLRMDRFDVLIVGAGPAGSFAAERLARGGVSVALFDGRPAGEPKACGGGVTSKALKAWPHLLEAVGRTIDELDMYSPSGKHLHLKLEEPFAVYSRIAFDTFLRERAREAGAQVFAEKISARGFKQTADGWIVRAQSGAEFSSEWLVGADGANSPIAKKLAGPLPPAEMEVAFGYRAPLPDDGNAATVVAFLPNWVGYAWAFPRIDHISFGIATTQDAFDHDSLDALMWDFMVSYYEVTC